MMYCSFRLYGDFIWPPLPHAADLPDTQRKRGVVEIYFAPSTQPEDGRWRALLRWRPGAAMPDELQEAPPATPNLFEAADPVGWFAEHGDEEIVAWIHGGPDKLGGEKVAFRGALLFEQTGWDSSARMRWPLVRKCRYSAKAREVLSELVVGQNASKKHPKARDNFRFNLQLPTPFPQTKFSAGDDRERVFPFCAVYDSDIAAPGRATEFDTLVGGAIDAGHGGNPSSFVFHEHEPQAKRLGAFGFSRTGTAGGGYAAYAGNEYDDDNGVLDTIELDRFWPRLGDASGHVKLFKAIGLDTGAEVDTAGLDLAGASPADMSFRPHPDHFAFRLTFKASGAGRVGKILWQNSQFGFDLDEEIGGRLTTTASRLHLDCFVSWTIADQDIWLRTNWNGKIEFRAHWEDRLSTNGLAANDPDLVDKPARPAFAFGMLPAAARAMRSAHAALYRTETAQPQSLLPALSASSAQTVRLALYAPPIAATFDANGDLNFAHAALAKATPLRLSLIDDHDLILPEKAEPLRLAAHFPGFFTEGGAVALPFYLKHDPNWPPTSWQAVAQAAGEPYFASFRVDAFEGKVDEAGNVIEDAPEATWRGRLCSMELQAAGAKLKYAGTLRVGGRGAGNPGAHAPDAGIPHPYPVAVEARFDLPFTAGAPLGVDQQRGDAERISPLLIPLGEASNAATGGFTLAVQERLATFADRVLTADIFDNSSEAGDQTYVVLSEEPFAINRFSNRTLGARGDAGTALVAHYSSVNRIWEWRRVSEYYRYSLPPQVVGESADKPRRLEIHDVTGVPAQDYPGEVPAPIVDRPYYRLHPAEPMDDLRRRAVEFRLTPSAELWIRPSDVDRGYFMPEWGSQAIFRQRGELGLGAALAGLRAEFLYGLPVGIEVAKERGASRRARVAEIEALTGRTVGAAASGSDFGERWNALSHALARRPERLEVWADDPDSVLDFAPARFADGVTFALRDTAMIRAAVTRDEAAGGPTETREAYTRAPARRSPSSLRYHPQGLSGGALWPVESANFFNALVDNPFSSGGEIESIALSPLGGDASQKALFLDGKVTIISRTRNGFVERQQVEVIGRVAALWHRAKHVVVYERTVNPTVQFAPLKAENPHGTRTRRPVLRKVREYIELLQPERSYPDFPQASARSAGFLDRVRFNSRIINVDSAWSRDVGKIGWEIPLWNRQAARQRPQVYPMPDVGFCSVAEGEGERPLVTQECRDPEHLYFFADFEAKGADTDIWPQRLAVDFANMPSAEVMARVVDTASADDPDDEEISGTEGRRPSVSRILPGLRRFTWRLAPSTRKVAINAGRAGKPLYVGLDSISFMRAGQNAANVALFDPLQGVLKASATAKPDTTAIDTLGYWAADGSGAHFAGAKDFSDAVGALKTLLEGNAAGDAIADARTVVEEKWLALAPNATLSGALQDEVAKVFEPVNSASKDIGSIIAKGKADCSRLKADAIGVVQRKAMLIEALLREWEAQADNILDADIPTTRADAIALLVSEVREAIRPAFDDAAGGIADFGESVEKARAIVADLQAEADATIDRAIARIRQHAASYDRDKPWSDERRRAFYNGLAASASGVAGDVLAAIEEARQRLATELDDVSQQIAGHVGRVLREVADTKGLAFNEPADFRTATASVFLSARRVLAPALSTAQGGTGTIEEALGKLDQIGQKIDDAQIADAVKQRARMVLENLRLAAGKVQETASKSSALIDKADGLTTAVDHEIAAVITAVAQAATDIAQDLQTTTNDLIDVLKLLSDAAAVEVKDAFEELLGLLGGALDTADDWAKRYLHAVGEPIDVFVEAFTAHLLGLAAGLRSGIDAAAKRIDDAAGDIADALTAAQAALAPNALLDTVVEQRVIVPVLSTLLQPLPEDFAGADLRPQIRLRLATVSASVAEAARTLEDAAADALGDISAACETVFEGVGAVSDYMQALAGGAEAYAQKQVAKAADYVTKLVGADITDIKGMLASLKAADTTIRGLQNDLSRSVETASAYGGRVLEAAGKVDDGGLMAAPSNILRLYSAVTSAPEIAALKADIDRLRAGFDDLSDIIKTTKANALFDRLGDELKALGLSLPFDSIGDRLLPVDLSSFDIGKVFRNFGGTRLDKLFKGYKLPQGVTDVVRITHDFDKQQARAWVQIDIDAPMPGRRSLFSVGVFSADFVDMRLTGQVRFEVSKDGDQVTQTGHGRIGTVVDLVVAGQSMVRFEKFGLNFARETGLDVEFDPKNIRINPAFKFIQDFLSTLFPDEAGGLNILKQDGIPVGLEHEFSLPPTSLNFGTSGITNITIGNRFQLLAYPEFVLADRFNLSRPERPFIFSIFIIGGTGYVQIDAEYRPFKNELMVAVEAAAGGSASLAFAFGPFSGQVFITLSVSLTYRKLIGRSGGGLSIGVVLVIAGYVNVAGIVTIGIYLMLRLTYRDSGQIDADGTLSVTIRISRFFKITARANIKYTLRGGKSETQISTGVKPELDGKLGDAAKKLQEART